MKKIARIGLLVFFVWCGAAAAAGFDEFGYNRSARLFNGTGTTWSVEQGLPADYLGAYASDKLLMKWSSEWDRGNDENWSNPPYEHAWTSNLWDGRGQNGSGEVWHYKIVWVGGELQQSPYWVAGGYPLWGQFEMVMDQGSSQNHEHIRYAHATPNGYGVK